MKKLAGLILLLMASTALAGPIGPPAGNPILNTHFDQNAEFNVTTGTVRDNLFITSSTVITGNKVILSTLTLSGLGITLPDKTVLTSTTQFAGGGGGTNFQPQINALNVSTAALVVSTTSLQTQINNLNVSTAAIASSTGTLLTRLTQVGLDTATLRSALNQVATDTTTLNSNFPVSLSTNVISSLADTSLSSNVALRNSTQTFSGVDTFSNVAGSSSTYSVNASSMNLQSRSGFGGSIRFMNSGNQNSQLSFLTDAGAAMGNMGLLLNGYYRFVDDLSAPMIFQTNDVDRLRINYTGSVDVLSSATVQGAGGLGVTYNLNVGSMTGAGLTVCGDSTHAVSWNTAGDSKFGCQAITASGGGASFSLAIGTGGPNAFSGVITSSSNSTTELLFSSTAFNTSLITGGTVYVTPNFSSMTAMGNTFNGNNQLLQLSGSGLVGATQFPALSGDITTSGGSLATTAAATQANITKITSALTLGANANSVTISSNLVTNGTTIYANGNIGTSLTASLPVKTNAASVLVAAAVDLSGSEVTGALAAGRFPALTGDITNSAGSLATTLSNSIGNPHNWTGTATHTSSVTINNAVSMGSPANAVIISSNVITPGATFYQGGSIYLGPTFSASLPLQLDASRKMTAAAIDGSGSQFTGTIAAARMPALTGDMTTSAGAVATTAAATQTNITKISPAATLFLGSLGQTVSIASTSIMGSTTFYANGTVYGNGLTACGDSSHALSWSGGTYGCQAITGSAAAGGTTGNIQYNVGNAITGASDFNHFASTMVYSNQLILTSTMSVIIGNTVATSSSAQLEVMATGQTTNILILSTDTKGVPLVAVSTVPAVNPNDFILAVSSLNGTNILTVNNSGVVGIQNDGNQYLVFTSTGYMNTTDATTTSNSTTSVNGFGYHIPANQTWAFEYNLLITGPTNGIHFGFNGPAASTITAVAFGSTSAVGTFSAASILFLNNVESVVFNSASTSITMRITGTMQTSSTSGTCQLQWESVTSGNTSTIKAGSYFIARRIL